MVSTRRVIPLIIGLAVLTIGGWLGSRYWLYSFLQSERCRSWLSETLADHIGGTASVARLQPQSLDAIYCEEITLDTPHPALKLKASQLRANVRFSFLSRFCDIDRLNVTRVHLAMGESPPTQTRAPANPATGEKPRYALHEITTEDFNLIWPGGELKRSALRSAPDPRKEGAWIANGAGGSVRLTSSERLAALEWRVEDYKARWHNGDFHLVNAALRSGREASLTLQGSITPSEGSEWTATYAGLPVETITDGDWRARLKGNLSGVVHLRRSGQTETWSSEGSVELREGEVTALPILDSLAGLTFTERFRQLPLHHASMRFSRSGDTSHTFSEIVIESTGQLRVEGAMTVTDGTVNGKFQLGLAPGDVRKIPGAATVFATERAGYLWAPVTLSGPIAAPAEDLSPRLVRAAAGEVVVQAGTLVRKKAKEAETTTRNVLDAVAPLLPLPVKPSSLLPVLPGE